MKKLYTWINEDQHKDFLERVKRLKLTPYAYLKGLVLADLGEPREKAHMIRTQILFGFVVYSLIASTLILLGFRLPLVPPGMWLTTGEPWDFSSGKYVPQNPAVVLVAGLGATVIFILFWFYGPRIKGEMLEK